MVCFERCSGYSSASVSYLGSLTIGTWDLGLGAWDLGTGDLGGIGN
jgi:hypothetical protein